jgi:hypothetical protein
MLIAKLVCLTAQGVIIIIIIIIIIIMGAKGSVMVNEIRSWVRDLVYYNYKRKNDVLCAFLL